MSVIHSSWVLLGRRSWLIAGTARCSTVRSMAYSRQARASTASPIHSRRPAGPGALAPPGGEAPPDGPWQSPPRAWAPSPPRHLLTRRAGTAERLGSKDIWVSRVERKDLKPRAVPPELRPLDADALHPASSCRILPIVLGGCRGQCCGAIGRPVDADVVDRR